MGSMRSNESRGEQVQRWLRKLNSFLFRIWICSLSVWKVRNSEVWGLNFQQRKGEGICLHFGLWNRRSGPLLTWPFWTWSIANEFLALFAPLDLITKCLLLLLDDGFFFFFILFVPKISARLQLFLINKSIGLIQ